MRMKQAIELDPGNSGMSMEQVWQFKQIWINKSQGIAGFYGASEYFSYITKASEQSGTNGRLIIFPDRLVRIP